MAGQVGLRGEAAIVGIAELPAQRKQTRPELFTIDQYAALAAVRWKVMSGEAVGTSTSPVCSQSKSRPMLLSALAM